MGPRPPESHQDRALLRGDRYAKAWAEHPLHRPKQGGVETEGIRLGARLGRRGCGRREDEALCYMSS